MNAVPPGQWMTQRAGILANDKLFQHWLKETNSSWRIMDGTDEEKAAMLTRVFCRVKSRKEIMPGTEAARLFDEMLGKYETWRVREESPMNVPAKQPVTSDIMESVLLKGDLAKLTPDERVRYYNEVCRSLGLNPLTQPFAYITLNNKLQLYALRACADQLRKVNSVSLQIVSREITNDILTVHVRATLPDGRRDEDLGTVFFPDLLRGEARANAELKAVTKAKRRATLSICGLGWLDETEVEDIPAAVKRPPRPAPNVMLPPHDSEIVEPDAPLADETLSLDAMAREAAMRGETTFNIFYKARTAAEKSALKSIGAELRVLMDEAKDVKEP